MRSIARFLKILQQDATATVAEVGRAVGLSTTPCWKRIQRFDASGIIKKRVAIVAREKVGLGVTVQVNIQSADHSPQAAEAFIEAVRAMPEVLEFQRVAGDADFSYACRHGRCPALRAGLVHVATPIVGLQREHRLDLRTDPERSDEWLERQKDLSLN